MIRIVGGSMRGRMIQAPSGIKTRPTSGMVREAVFSMLQRVIPGANVLDAFCGSGALAFEALSRGAEHAVLIDYSSDAITVARKNANTLGVGDHAEIYQNDYARALSVLAQQGRLFDVVFLDPPYSIGYYERALLLSFAVMKDTSLAVLEHDSGNPLPDVLSGCRCIKRKQYGKRAISIYQKGTE